MNALTEDEKKLATLMVKNRILSSSGTGFEDLFTTIMRGKYVDFRQVKPQGKKGDRKNDGFIPSTGEYFQVYSPEEPENKKHKSGAKKALEDFKALHEYWNGSYEVKIYNFVLNDKYRGTYAEVHTSLAEIKKGYKIKTHLFDAQELEDLCLELTRTKLESVIGGLPDPDNISLDFSVLNNVVGYLMRRESHTTKADKLNVPDFGEKIKFNNLSDYVALMLNNASLSLHQLEEYFESYGTKGIRDILKTEFVRMYEKHSNDGSLDDDSIFIQILEDASYDVSKGDNGNKGVRDAVLVLMAYYFETCDIFEEPSKTKTT